MNLNVEVNLHNSFKAATAAQGKNMTDVLIEYIEQYVTKHSPQPRRKAGADETRGLVHEGFDRRPASRNPVV